MHTRLLSRRYIACVAKCLCCPCCRNQLTETLLRLKACLSEIAAVIAREPSAVVLQPRISSAISRAQLNNAAACTATVPASGRGSSTHLQPAADLAGICRFLDSCASFICQLLHHCVHASLTTIYW
jgi:hypothetical protein